MNDRVLKTASANLQSKIGPLRSALRGASRLYASAIAALLSVFALAAFIATATPANAGPPVEPGSRASSSRADTVAVFSGDYVGGVPVYHLPRMTVVARRPTDLAKNERRAQPAGAGEARARAAAKPAA